MMIGSGAAHQLTSVITPTPVHHRASVVEDCASRLCCLHRELPPQACNPHITMNSALHIFDNEDDYRKRIVGDPKDTVYQIILSAIFGVGALITFCVRSSRQACWRHT